MSVPAERLAALRMAVARIETGWIGEATGFAAARMVPLGHAVADASLGGGLRRAVLHEVFAAPEGPAAAAGFALGLVARCTSEAHGSQERAILHVRQDLCGREHGEVAATGLVSLGLDPARLVIVRTGDVEGALRAAADGAACTGLGAVLVEFWGSARAYDLSASRRLTLAAAETGVTVIVLRAGALPEASAAETRWLVHPAPSPAASSGLAEMFGAPIVDAALIRNRHGPSGRWTMEWSSDHGLFREPTPSGRLAATASDRPDPALRIVAGTGLRRAG